jgi:SAM-dependent methyltransferase
MPAQELERELARLLHLAGTEPLGDCRLLEVGCGSGGNLATFIRLGFRPENLVGNDLLEERAVAARLRLPSAVRVFQGDASQLDLPPEQFDIVFQSLVFSSVLENSLQRALAEKMWSWVKPGGGVLWYDFTYDNPSNPDVRGVKRSDIKQLFPEGAPRMFRLTLAPPISRVVTRVHPALYCVFNALPLLRTHLLCWIAKPHRPALPPLE